MISLKRSFSYARYYYLLYIAAFLLVAGLGLLAVRQSFELSELEVRDYDGYRCLTGSTFDLPGLRILDAVYTGDTRIADALCDNPAVADTFSAVEIRRESRDKVDLREIVELHYHLVLSKPEMLERVAGGTVPAYRVIARYPSYGSQLVSLQDVPRLEAAYFEGKTLGLLDDPNSRSGYQIPKAALREAGLDGEVDIIYFKSHRQLYEALFEGEVDVIASIRAPQHTADSVRIPNGLPLADQLSGPAWYLHPDLYQTPLHCEVEAALRLASSRGDTPYLNQLDMASSCQ